VNRRGFLNVAIESAAGGIVLSHAMTGCAGGDTDNDRIVTAFCEACERMDAGELIEYFQPDAVYHNIPLPALRGRAEIQKSLEGLPTRFRRLRIETRHQVSAGDIVLNERTDIFTFPDGGEVALPITGVFEMRRGKIQAWREYFDLATFKRRG
jgi:limonene-1,2-epoxide hydrolase